MVILKILPVIRKNTIHPLTFDFKIKISDVRIKVQIDCTFATRAFTKFEDLTFQSYKMYKILTVINKTGDIFRE